MLLDVLVEGRRIRKPNCPLSGKLAYQWKRNIIFPTFLKRVCYLVPRHVPLKATTRRFFLTMHVLVPTSDILVAWMGNFHLKDEQFEVFEFPSHSGIHKSQTLSPMAPAFSALLKSKGGFARSKTLSALFGGISTPTIDGFSWFLLNHIHPWTLEQRLMCLHPQFFTLKL